MCAAVGAAKRAWRPVGQMLLWQVQATTHGHSHAPAAMIRSLSILSYSSSNSGRSSSGNTTSWLYRTVANDVVLPARSFGAEGPWCPSLTSSASQVRFSSGSSALPKEEEPEEQPQQQKAEREAEVINSNYWGVTAKSFTKEDGTAWQWNCFRPTETYTPNIDIDINRHRDPTSYNEWIAMWIIRMIKIPVNLFYNTRYGCRAMMLETVAAVPGMVGGMLLHLRSLRRFEHSGGWIKALLDEAENERMHLMTLMELVQPAWYERALVVAVQGVFFNIYFVLYLLSPRLAHRITGYLEEEAVISYTTFLDGIDKGVVENVPAPAIAIDYWRLPPDATLRDMVLALRADECHHRDVNHFAADVRQEGKQLNESPAPVDFH